MSNAIREQLEEQLEQIERPGAFCVSGSVPDVEVGLEARGLGPIRLPLSATQAKQLRKRCEQAPYGKGEATIVDTSVRRVWRMKPANFQLTNPDWPAFLQAIVLKVQHELGLEKQQLDSHLYDLLLYEPGSFFLPHRDGEKLERMVATLVVVLPSTFQGGELVVRHDGQQETVRFRSRGKGVLPIHYAAFYADCEHEIRPLREGYRLCLVYNLTLKKGKKTIGAPRTAAAVAALSQLLSTWAGAADARRLAIPLEHQYTKDGLAWDMLKGQDRARAQVLAAAARQADCQVYLTLLTFHESGAGEEIGGSYRRRRWDDDDDAADGTGKYVMVEVFDSKLTGDQWIDPDGNRVPLGEIPLAESDLLDAEAMQAVTPEEQFEGFTGNEGMTLDRWYRRAALVLWPNRRHFDNLCDAGTLPASRAPEQMTAQLPRAGKKAAAALRAQCHAFAVAIIARWPDNPYVRRWPAPESAPLPRVLARLDDAELINAFLRGVLARDAAVTADDLLPAACQRHGWETFAPALTHVFEQTTSETLTRNVHLLEQLAAAGPAKKAGWRALCETLASALVQRLEQIDAEKPVYDYRLQPVDRAAVLAGLARALLLTVQFELMTRLITHALALPRQYPLTEAHVAALTALRPWIKKHIKQAPPLTAWLAASCQQLAERTAREPAPPADLRRAAALACKCKDCTAVNAFLKQPTEQVYRLPAAERQRRHVDQNIRAAHADLDVATERRGSPYALVLTKNTASFQATLKKYHQDVKDLAALRAIEAGLST